TKFTSNTNYAGARTGTVAAATELYGAGSAEVTAVENAWAAVNVGTRPGGVIFENPTNIPIPDLSVVTSPISVTGRAGNAPATLRVGVDIIHTWRGDLVIELVAPDGSAYLLKSSNSIDSADNVQTTYTVNASSEVANGTWRLRVRDVARYDTGYINSWKLTF
ncbi:proprotein convertase P-domain-containing protein, partial [Streptomyces sp. NPDC004787]|uniref:proprotein convertase P-domain-containing protein n=1 Tax=Streptomyces sp. NPDC004787 TaxID=3154291 RepID=UPI0033BD0116